MTLIAEPNRRHHRTAGILLHITSLPGPAYIGDIGPAARNFADMLHNGHQQVWQMIPVQPTSQDQGYSPYSAPSAMAGNHLLISPELLVHDGVLAKKNLKPPGRSSDQVNYEKAGAYKTELLDRAWKNSKAQRKESDRIALQEYIGREGYWLNDYALYALLKIKYKNAPWYQWPAKLKHRDKAALREFSGKHADELDKLKWIQMIFDKQWASFRSYCETQQVSLIGDVPIYVAHDSADVWSNPEIFSLNEDGSVNEMAGVPPDLFNDDGQLWGMPIFRWHVLERKGYDWWIKRFRRNLQWFDIIRLDHFRGFSSYWSVSANSKTAKDGKWVKGPGMSLFNTLKQELGELPFIAEDLGEIDKPVYDLRDELELPGMNVLQFAFGDNMPFSDYLPHHHQQNSIVYTGTHDNNTTVGWFRELDSKTRSNLSGYTGVKITTTNVAEQMIRLAYMSVANLAVIPMQDVLSLDAAARMNKPATPAGNWKWRLKKEQLDKKLEEKLYHWCYLFNRLRATGSQ